MKVKGVGSIHNNNNNNNNNHHHHHHMRQMSEIVGRNCSELHLHIILSPLVHVWTATVPYVIRSTVDYFVKKK